jgi:hypothetical protein
MSDGSKEQHMMTAGVDLGDKYSYLCLIDTLRAARLSRKVGCAPPHRPSDDASPPSPRSAHRRRNGNPLALG